MLQVPPHHQLRRRAIVLLRQFNDGLVFHLVSSRERRVGFDDDVVVFAILSELCAGVKGVDLDLVDGGEQAGGGGEEFGDLTLLISWLLMLMCNFGFATVTYMLLAIIAHTRNPHFTFEHCIFQCLPAT